MDAVIQYAQSEDQCRSVQLLAYFGEPGSGSCGSCDVCRGEHQSGISNSEFEEISLKIRQLLLVVPMDIKEVVSQCNGNEKSVLKVARWLLDHGDLEINASNLLVLKR